MGAKSLLRGVTVDSLIGLDPEDFLQLDVKFQRAVVDKLSSAANSRLERLNSAGLLEYSQAGRREYGRRFSVAGKTEEELLSEFNRVTSFMRSSTSTIKGARKFKKELEDLLEAGEEDTIYTASGIFIRLINYASDNFYDLLHSDKYILIKDKASEISHRRAAWTETQFIEAAGEFREFLDELYREESLGSSAVSAEFESKTSFSGNMGY